MTEALVQPGRYPAIRQVKAWQYPAPSEEATIKSQVRLMPGTGKIKDEECGMFTAIAVCSSNPDHDKKPIQKSCNRLECPICHTRTLTRNAEAVASRVNGYREALVGQRTLGGDHAKMARPPRGGTLSPPQSIINAVYDRTIKSLKKKHPEGFTGEDVQLVFMEKFRYEAYKAMEILGIDGAAVIIHFDRVNDLGKALHEEAAPNKPRWEWVRDQPDFRDLIYFSPHVHLMYYGTSMPTKDFYEASGCWVFKMVREVEDVPRLAYYLLSHAPIIHGRLSVTYWGCLSPRKLQAIDEHIVKEEVLCEKCGAVMVYASIDGQGEIQHITDRPLYRKHRVRTYAIREPPARKNGKRLKRQGVKS